MIYCVPAADISGVDWMVRHGRSLALANAVKSAPEQLYAEEYRDTVAETILTNATADRVSTGTLQIVDHLFWVACLKWVSLGALGS